MPPQPAGERDVDAAAFCGAELGKHNLSELQYVEAWAWVQTNFLSSLQDKEQTGRCSSAQADAAPNLVCLLYFFT